MEILLCCLSHKYSLCSIIKERHLYSWKNFRGTSENHEKRKSLAQRIFPRLQYIKLHMAIEMIENKGEFTDHSACYIQNS